MSPRSTPARGVRPSSPVQGILGIGVDIVAPARLAAVIDGTDSPGADLIFTANEVEACAHRVDRVQALGARFAAKEALFKALGTGWTEGVSFLDAEVTNGPGGRPTMRLWRGVSDRAEALGVCRLHLSLSHDAGVAAAMVVLEGNITPHDD